MVDLTWIQNTVERDRFENGHSRNFFGWNLTIGVNVKTEMSLSLVWTCSRLPGLESLEDDVAILLLI